MPEELILDGSHHEARKRRRLQWNTGAEESKMFSLVVRYYVIEKKCVGVIILCIHTYYIINIYIYVDINQNNSKHNAYSTRNYFLTISLSFDCHEGFQWVVTVQVEKGLPLNVTTTGLGCWCCMMVLWSIPADNQIIGCFPTNQQRQTIHV